MPKNLIKSFKSLDLFAKTATVTVTVLFVLLIASTVYAFIRIADLKSATIALNKDLSSLSETLASTTARLDNDINTTKTNLADSISSKTSSIQSQLGSVQQQVGNVSGTVNTLQKLSKTDPELLKKYSKVYFLNEYYVPSRLTDIPNEYEYSARKQLLIHTDVWPHLKSMFDDAAKSGVTMYAFSAYRSFKEQQLLKGSYTVNYGAGTANSFSADQGYSEHQLGTTLDIIAPGQGGVLDGFDDTSAYKWLLANAYRYGFILSYPKGNNYYVFEPWHWRYVGVKLATELHDQGKTFYDMDQRTIDEYLVSIFD